MGQADTDAAQEIFDYWRRIHGHERARMDDKRRRAITAMLSIGYSENDLKLAIFGCKWSTFHQGRNDGQTIYDAITLILRDAEHVDKFMAIGESRMREIESRRQQRAELAAIPAPATASGEVYKENRSALLSLVRKKA